MSGSNYVMGLRLYRIDWMLVDNQGNPHMRVGTLSVHEEAFATDEGRQSVARTLRDMRRQRDAELP